MERRLGIGIDLGATRLRVCLGTDAGEILRRETRKMELSKKVDDYLSQITTATKVILNGIEPGDVKGVCVASPGPLDLRRGVIAHTPNLPYPEVPVIAALREALGIDAYLVNDANAGSLGEWLRGAGKGHDDVFFLTISTGIGGGAVVDGRMLLGKDGNAAEVGHTTIDSSGRLRCGCGRHGHWEAYCSGTGIPALARLMAAENIKSEQGRTNREYENAADVFKRASEGESLSLKVVKEVGRLNAIGIANIVDSFDPEIVTIGGGVALNNPDAILSPIKENVGAYAINGIPEVLITPLGDDAGLLGALSVSFNPSLIQR